MLGRRPSTSDGAGRAHVGGDQVEGRRVGGHEGLGVGHRPPRRRAGRPPDRPPAAGATTGPARRPGRGRSSRTPATRSRSARCSHGESNVAQATIPPSSSSSGTSATSWYGPGRIAPNESTEKKVADALVEDRRSTSGCRRSAVAAPGAPGRRRRARRRRATACTRSSGTGHEVFMRRAPRPWVANRASGASCSTVWRLPGVIAVVVRQPDPARGRRGRSRCGAPR